MKQLSKYIYFLPRMSRAVGKPPLSAVIKRCAHNSPYEHGIHRSDAEKLVNQVPVIEIKGDVAICDGGGGGLGHPVEYIQLKTVYEDVSICKYCGLRFKRAHGFHGH